MKKSKMMKGFKLLIVGLCSLFILIGFGYGILYTVDSETLNCVNGPITYELSGLPKRVGISDLGDGGNYNLCFTCENNVSGRCGNTLVQGGYTTYYNSDSLSVGCNGNGISKVVITCKASGDDFSIIYTGNSCPGGGSCPECPTCPEINTGEILSGYILESDIDNLYCEEHGYCPLIDTGLDNTGVEWSALYINEIQHNSAPLINITIPEEFDWDYSGSDEEFDLEVKGYNVDTEYVDGLIRSQNFKPNSDDFSSILTGLVPLFVPGLAIILFLYFVFRFVKKVF